MSTHRRAIIIVRVADRDAANADAATLDPAAGDTFCVSLCTPPDLVTVTHYWCSWGGLTSRRYTALLNRFDGIGSRRFFDGDLWSPEAVLTELGLATMTGEP